MHLPPLSLTLAFMMIMNKKSNKYIQVIFILFFLYSSAGCSSFQALKNGFESLDHFEPHPKDSRILVEPGADAFAETIHSHLPESVESVESKQYSVFPGNVAIYACKSKESFHNYTGANVSAMAYRKSIFLSPKLLEKPETVKTYLTHELSHLHLYQHIGGYKYIKIPSWFTEGLASYVSNGGGAEKVNDEDVKISISSGNHFHPHDTAGLRDLFIKRYASYWGIEHENKHHLFYRQCMLFISYIHKEHPNEFKKFIIELEHGSAFKSAFTKAFGTDTETIWKNFKQKITS